MYRGDRPETNPLIHKNRRNITQYGTTECYLRRAPAGYAPHDDTGRATLVCYVRSNGAGTAAYGFGCICNVAVCRYRNADFPLYFQVECASLSGLFVCLPRRLCLGEGDGYVARTDGDAGAGLCLSGRSVRRTDVFRYGGTHQVVWREEDSAVFPTRRHGSYRHCHRTGAVGIGYCQLSDQLAAGHSVDSDSHRGVHLGQGHHQDYPRVAGCHRVVCHCCLSGRGRLLASWRRCLGGLPDRKGPHHSGCV